MKKAKPNVKKISESVEVKVAEIVTAALVKENNRRRKPRFSIGFKLISIISLLIVSSLASMIVLASYFFRDDTTKSIEENNHKIAQLISLKVKSDFVSIMNISAILSTVGQTVELSKKIFEQNSDIIFIGIAQEDGGKFKLQTSIVNAAFCETKGIGEKDVLSSVQSLRESYSRSFAMEQVVNNCSVSLKIPVIGFSMPLKKKSDTLASSILIVYTSMDSFNEAVQTFGLVKPFIVNNAGDVIAHENTKLVMAGVNLKNLPIVTMMMKSPLNNGQTSYKDQSGTSYLGAYRKVDFGNIGVVASVDVKKAFESVERIQFRNMMIMLIVLNLSIIIVFFFSKSITNPIKQLVGATHEIEKGNFEYKMQKLPSDEFGMLMRSFNEMIKGLSDRDKMKDAFSKFVNKEIAEQVLSGTVKLGGERKTAAVFFSDIRAFTAISEKLEPEEIVEFLNEYMTAMVDCVNATHGNVDKYIGDAIMAVWGAPVSFGNDTENAINGALMMRESLMEFNKGRGGDKKPVIKIGSGINSGPVLAGQIGSNDKMSYTVIGDTVNLASRIEALNKPFGTDILISDDSYQFVKDIFVVEKMPTITVKGKVKPQQIWAVIGRKDDPNRPKSLADIRKMLGVDVKNLPIFNPDEDHEEKFKIVGKKEAGKDQGKKSAENKKPVKKASAKIKKKIAIKVKKKTGKK